MLSVVMYGRNDNHGYNLHRRAAISLNCIAALLSEPSDEIIFVDYNTPDDLPTFPEAISDTLTAATKEKLRVLRARPPVHERFRDQTHLVALESISRNIAVRRSNPVNQWILSTNSDMIFVPRRHGDTLSGIVSGLAEGFYELPRFELPETLWESFDRLDAKGTLAAVEKYAKRFHLNDVVHNPPTLFDGPGDFQLMLRKDIFSIHGFDETMIHGWHVDSNLCLRMTQLRGRLDSLLDSLFGYHCDHTRQATGAHGHGRVENDLQRYEADGPHLLRQKDDWGIPDVEIEELRLGPTGANAYVAALDSVISDDGPDTFYEHSFVPESFGDLVYPAAHVLPYLCDLLAALPRRWSLTYFGCRLATFDLVCRAWKELGFHGNIWIAEGFVPALETTIQDADLVRVAPQAEVIERADLFVFEFGFASQDRPAAEKSRPDKWTPEDVHCLTMTKLAFEKVAEGEAAGPDEGRRLVAINAIYNLFEAVIASRLATNHTPYSSRLRHGFVIRENVHAEQKSDLKSLVGWLTTRLARARMLDGSEVNDLLRLAEELSAARRQQLDVPAPVAAAAIPLLALLEFPALHHLIAIDRGEIVQLRQDLALSRPSEPIAKLSQFPLRADKSIADRPLSALNSILDWERADWFMLAMRYFGGANYLQRNRGIWERTQMLYGLDRLGLLQPDKTCVVFVTMPDAIYLLLSEIVARVEVELPASAVEDGTSGVADQWWRPRAFYLVENLAFEFGQKSDAQDSLIDFAVLPHNTGLSHGSPAMWWYLERVAARLKLGGYLVMSAEITLDRETTWSYLGRDLITSDLLRAELGEKLGLELLGPFDEFIDTETLDRTKDLSRRDGDLFHHFIVSHEGIHRTTAVLFFRKIAEPRANASWDLFTALMRLNPRNLLRYMTATGMGMREGDALCSVPNTTDGAFVYGPYIELPEGRYRLRARVKIRSMKRWWKKKTVLNLEVVIGAAGQQLALRSFYARQLALRSIEIDFDVPPEFGAGARGCGPIQFLFHKLGGADLMLTSMELSMLRRS